MILRSPIQFFIFLMVVSSLTVYSSEIDSLKTALQQAKHDTTRCNILNAIVDASSDDEFWPAFNQEMEIISAKEIVRLLPGDPLQKIYFKYFAIALSNRGYLQQMKGDLDGALNYYLKSLRIEEYLNYKLGITTNLNNIASIYKNRGEFSNALMRYQQNMKVQQELNDLEGVGVSLNNIGAIYRDQGEISEAIDYYNKSLNIRMKIKDQKGIANSLNNLALVYQSVGDISRALNLNYESLKLWENLKNKSGVSASLNNIGLLFSNQGDFSKALDYYKKSIAIDKETGDKNALATTLNNIGYIYTQFNNREKALEAYLQSLALRKELGEMNGVAVTLNNIGTIYDNKMDYTSALDYYRQSLAIREEIGHKEGIAYSLNSIANVLYKQKQTTQALVQAQRGLQVANGLGYPANIRQASLLLSRIFASQGNYKNAYDMFVLFNRMDDSIKNENNRKSLLKKEFTYKYEKKETQVRLLKQQQEMNVLKLEAQQHSIARQRYLLVILLALILFISVSVYYYLLQQNTMRRIDNENTVRQTEEKERQRIAKDIHDELGSGLSKIKFLSELANPGTTMDQQTQKHLNSISVTASELVENMRDLVWAMNPDNTSLDNLVARIREYSHDYFEEFPIELKVDIPDNISSVRISKEIYRNVFMITKEILQNIIKHSSASEVLLKVILTDTFCLEIRDNGTGFDPGHGRSGNGLKNIINRADIIGGQVSFESVTNQGSKVKFCIKI